MTPDSGSKHASAPRFPALQGASRDHLYPRFDAAQIDRMRRFGTIEHWRAGDAMFRTGQAGLGMRVLIRGQARLTRRDGLGRSRIIAELSDGQFLGEVAQLTGKPALADGLALTDVEALMIPPEQIRTMLVAEAQIGETIMRSIMLRRFGLIQDGGGPVLIGPASDMNLIALEGLLHRLSHPYSVVDPEADPEARLLLDSLDGWANEYPVVMLADGTLLRQPSPRELAARLGILLKIDTARTYDVAVVGAGPAGLAAAVYAASEGLSVIVFDGHGPGGQAGASARIENYLGFPTGVSGHELAANAFVQAVKFGAEIIMPARVRTLDCAQTPRQLVLEDGQRIAAHTVVIATGAAYRRPAIAGLDEVNGCGVHYWASSVEGRLCRGTEVVLIGGGNSAGQAAVFLASHASRVHLLIRGADLARSMSRYLIDRIASLDNVVLHAQTVVTAVTRDQWGLDSVVCETPGGEQCIETRHLFLFTGAAPNTQWLHDCSVEIDEKGFVKTGYMSGVLPETACFALQTNVPGVFAIGDTRAASAKRVAAAVGDGAAVVSEIHQFLSSSANTA
ncbi:cyclic nucleotide-regulated FAD-dependent pyridine nucleotide-disulphide oxidoreductase [Paraburkholderia fungorum]|uniref:Cyclic nucleotide-regulated FAD-dependent pyridine nucleotide-disulphide oxidoreductase n=1 Tax=Paraburkholderia fungorum TaxID=134537 RepID=A0A1H1JIX9_9BURK|nr:FAD-dependent oxidoreductase [Paraburkholderia fungorum]SDR49595.1 cyclic nucleotide-regulated FAD-dependent pyridine nucleotide-disulphide oxidoreductase [Paraburkholderia fungorum]